jgi:hypothetical protein
LRSPTLSSKNRLRSKKRCTKASPFLARILSLSSLSCVLKTVFTAELRKLLAYKEELLTDIKNMLYHRTDDVDTEQQFIDCFSRSRRWAKKRNGARKSWRT